MEFSGAEVNVAITGADGPAAAPPTFKMPAPPGVDRSFSRDTTDDADPVSIADLEAVFQPGHAPPLWDAAPEAVSSDRAPISLATDSAPSSFQPVSDRDLVWDADSAESPDSAPPPAIGRKPSFFRVDELPAPRMRLFDAEPAPFDPSVPALPGRLDPPELSDEDRLNPDSGLLDIRQLVAREEGQLPRPKREENRADDDDIFNLSGGLFASGASGPLGAPDLRALIAPVLPESSRPSALLEQQKSTPARPKSPVAATLSANTGASGSSAPVVSERRVSPAPTASSRRGARAGWAVAIAALGVGLVFVSLMLGKSTTSTTIMAVETAPPAIAPAETTRPVMPIVAAPPPELPASTSAPRDPGAVVRRDKDPVAAIPATPPPRATAIAALPAAIPLLAVAAPIVTAPPVAAPPPPSSGAEFNTSAAKASLAAAAGRALGCKQPDDPSGGATVSVTFAPSGRVTSSKVTSAPFQGTVMGGCIASAFRSASVPPFEGAPVTVTKNVSIR